MDNPADVHLVFDPVDLPAEDPAVGFSRALTRPPSVPHLDLRRSFIPSRTFRTGDQPCPRMVRGLIRRILQLRPFSGCLRGQDDIGGGGRATGQGVRRTDASGGMVHAREGRRGLEGFRDYG